MFRIVIAAWVKFPNCFFARLARVFCRVSVACHICSLYDQNYRQAWLIDTSSYWTGLSNQIKQLIIVIATPASTLSHASAGEKMSKNGNFQARPDVYCVL